MRSATHHRVLHTARDLHLRKCSTLPPPARTEDVTRDDERADHLLDEKRVAVGEVVDRLQEVGTDRPLLAEDRPQDAVDAEQREPGQCDLGGEPLAIKHRQQMPQTRGDLVAPIR